MPECIGREPTIHPDVDSRTREDGGMRTSPPSQKPSTALCVLLSAAIALSTTSALAQQSTTVSNQSQTQSATDPAQSTSTNTEQNHTQTPAAAPTPSTSAPATPDQPPAEPSAPQQQQKDVPGQPVGTAVAPYEKGIGVAASRPAGAVIAPAKQRRTRSFLIKGGLILGAAVAVGTVVGLSSSSSSRPH